VPPVCPEAARETVEGSGPATASAHRHDGNARKNNELVLLDSSRATAAAAAALAIAITPSANGDDVTCCGSMGFGACIWSN